jgi:rod shape-determining protein MreD
VWQYRWGTWIVAPVLALVLQTSLLTEVFPPNDVPNLVLAGVVAFAFFETPRRGLILGAVAGLLTDLAAGRLIGLNLALLAGVGWLVAVLQSRIVRDDVFVPGLVGAMCQVAVRVLGAGLAYAAGYRMSVSSVVGVLPVDILFGLFMTPALIALLHLRPRHEVDQSLKF